MHLLLDMDGTLIDSSIGIHHSFCIACDVLSLKCPDYSDFVRFIGPPVNNIAKSIFPDLSDEQLQDFCSIFRSDYDNCSFSNLTWYPGTHHTLKLLSDSLGLDMTIVTNKPTKPAFQIVENAGLNSCFKRIIGIDYKCCLNNGALFPTKAEAIQFALETHSKSTPFKAYVGDTIGDKAACIYSGVQFVAALYGFYQWSEDDLPPLHINEFKDILTRLPLIRL